MKIKLASILFLSLISTLSFSCIDKGQTVDALFEKDIKDIAKYVETSSMVNVKEFIDPVTGISVIWQEVSNSGFKVTRGDTIATDYTGKLLNNVVFDTSIEAVAKSNNIFNAQRRYSPLRFRTSSGTSRPLVIIGFEFGLIQLERGDKATILMPSEAAYGSNPPAGVPLNAPLIFEVNMIEVKAGPNS
jgi:FKBP-type peptidyl-prolyl cis-trans isomerase FklB